MREIKFRAWNDTEKRMLDWKELLLSNDRRDLVSALGREYHPTNSPKYFFEVMQFTEVLDKNGKEIYEGDIVLVPFYGERRKDLDKIIVNWYNSRWSLDAVSECYGGISIDSVKHNIEVIGNIFENPELL
jgi:uncharacterized phage protein (TIGR01671 family)